VKRILAARKLAVDEKPPVQAWDREFNGINPSRAERQRTITLFPGPRQVNGYTPSAFSQFIDSQNSALFLSPYWIIHSKIPRNIDDHARKIVTDRSGKI
jgi:hypothetical protein